MSTKAHTATVTWAFVVWQIAQKEMSLYAKEQELLCMLEFLSAPFNGILLRGAPKALASTLLDVAARYRQTREMAAAATYNVNGDCLPALCVLAALQGGPDSLEHVVVHMTRVTHRHPRVIASVAFAVSALRSLLMQPHARLDNVVQDAKLFAMLALKYYATLLDAEMLPHVTGAQHALEHTCALALQARIPDVMDFPLGLDGRDSPEQIVVWVLLLAFQKTKPTMAVLQDLRVRQPTASIALPLYAIFVATRAADELEFDPAMLEKGSEEMSACFAASISGRTSIGLEGLLFEEYGLSTLLRQRQQDSGLETRRHEKLAQMTLF